MVPPPRQPPSGRGAFGFGTSLAAFLASAGVVWLAHHTAGLSGGIAPIWLATGLGIWLVLRFGRGMLPVIAAGGMAAYWLPGTEPSAFPIRFREIALVAALAVARAIAAGCGAWLWRWQERRWRNLADRFAEPARCLFVALAAAAVAATIGTAAVVCGTAAKVAEAPYLSLHWWISDVIGTLFVLPVLLAAPDLAGRLRQAGASSWGRGALVLVAAIGASSVVFGWSGGLNYLFILFPVLLLATVAFGPAGARLVACVIAATITGAALRGAGPFVAGSLWNRALTLQIFLLVVAVVALFLPALQTRRNLLQRVTLATLLGGWAIGGVLFALLQRQQERATTDDFARLSGNAEIAIGERLTAILDTLHSGASLLQASPVLSQADWTNFVTAIGLQQRYPGVSGLSAIYPVPPEATADFLRRRRADGAPDFAIHALPGASAAGPERFVITDQAPLAGNEAALGLDIASEATRRRAAEAARDTGQPQATDRITLVQDRTSRPGFALLLPVYQPGAPLETIAERRAALKAWLSAPVVTETFLRAALAQRLNRLDFYFFAEGPLDAAHLLFSTAPLPRVSGGFARTSAFTFGGRTYTLAWNPAAGFQPNSESLLVWVALSFAVTTLLLAEFALNLETLREQAEQLARHSQAAQGESEARFRAIFDQAPMGVFLTELETGHYLRANGHLCRILGYAHEELAQIDFRTITHPEDLDETVEKARQLVRREISAFSIEKRYRRKDGKIVWARLTVAGMAPDRGPITHAVGTIEDITDRREMQAALRASEERFRALSEAAFEGIVISENGRMIDANDRALALFGTERGELIGRAILDFVAPGSRDLVAEAVRREAETTYEHELQRKDGTIFLAEARARMMRLGDRQVRITALRDITERKRAEAERAQLEHQLLQSQKLEAVGRMAGGIAHDFNNILAGIYGFTALARTAAADQSEQLDYLDGIDRAAQRAAELVRQLLAFSQPRLGDEPAGPVPLGRIVREAAKLLQATIPRTIEIAVHVEPDLPAVHGNVSQLHQMVMNLGTNAAHALRERPGLLSFGLAACTVDAALAQAFPGLSPGSFVRLTVSDTGGGMDAATRQRVFEPFFTTKAPGEGSGLGLSVVHGIVRSHRGALRLTSEVGRGTCFEIFLPVAAEPPAVPAPVRRTPTGRGERILLVDDEEPIARVGRLLLGQLGYVAESESHVLRALERLERDPRAFDLVVSDQTMPKMTGLEFAARVRALRPELPVILASGFSEFLTPENIQAAGGREVLTKPYTRAQLGEVVHRHLPPARRD